MLLLLISTGLLNIAQPGPAPAQGPVEPIAPELAVSLADPGAEPRHAIRYSPEEGSTETMVMTMALDVAMSVGGQPLPAGRTPPMRLTLQLDVEDVEDDGDVRYTMRLTRAEALDAEGVPAELGARVRDSLQTLVGLTGEMVMSDRGVTRRAEFTLPGDAGPEMEQMLAGMRQSLSQFSSPVPEEPVGPGARWTVRTRTTANGLRLDQTMTYDLESIDEAGAAMKVGYTQTAEPQRVTPAGLPPGLLIELKSLAGTGSGGMRVNFADLVPAASSIDGQTKTTMAVTSQGSTQEMIQEVSVEVTIAPGDAPAKPE